MLKTRTLKVNIQPLKDRYLITAQNSKDQYLEPTSWKYLLFSRHEESFYGTMLTDAEVNGIRGVTTNGWQLVTMLAKEDFNPFIHWSWDENSHICLSAAHSIYDAILEKEWLPDFHAWEESEFRWALPESVQQEFGPSFWEQTIEASDGEAIPVQSFVHEWFHHSLNSYLEKNQDLREHFGDKIKALQQQQIPPATLAAYFDEETWSEWLGLKASDVPFTIGLRLVEPEDVDGSWDLGIFLRGKEEPGLVVDAGDDSNMPAGWLDDLDVVDREQERWIRLFPWLRGHRGISSELTENEAWEFLTDSSEILLALGVEILLPSWWQAMKSASLKMKARVKGTGASHRPSFVGLQAVLDYDWRFSMNGVELSEDEFSQLVEEKRRLVFIRGRWIKLDPGFVRQIQDLMKQAEKEGLHVRDLIAQELMNDGDAEVDPLDDPKAFAKIQIEMNRSWKKMISQLQDIKTIPLEPVPSGFCGELRPYQVLGMSWMLFLRKYGFGAVLADDMGLGKTIQLISYLLSVKENGERSGKGTGTGDGDVAVASSDDSSGPDAVASSSRDSGAGPALIICPTSVLGNWQKEIERFAPSMNVYLHYGSNRLKGEEFARIAGAADVVLTSYGLSHLDFTEFESLTWGTITIDEAQNIKNANTKQSRAVRKLRGQHHIALTGTPMENRLSELWSIFDFTNHGYLGGLTHFQKRFVLPIEKDDDKAKIQELQALIRPFLLRRSKKDEEVALNLPDKLEQKEYCPLTVEQASLYEQLVRDTFDSIEKLSGFERKGLILQMLSRLKQLCNHPALYLKEPKPHGVLERSSKLEKLNELVEVVLGQKESCLIFTQYIEMGNMIKKVLEKNYGIEVPFLNGSVPKSQRDTMIASFQNREFPVFILSLKAGGTGLNLTAANHVIHYDRWWNPAVENQATDRAYRIGQSRFVHVHKFISTGTLEEKIDAMLEKKQSLNDQIIQNDHWITELSTDDLRDLVLLS
ncbi:DEAD/DEAH box helicase [Bacillus massilinigeriensis]|uniref:DEAD/DEAH box helicase n=1 Tax=Bacillus massilionigeriensis TaxID=1805475 RepID=UPI00096B2A53|nr:DEAD/DEAH box helicase [Bacillus massilionigeriensis]